MRFFLFFFLLLSFSGNGQSLVSAPMNGYTTMREVLIWTQYDDVCTSHIKYWKKQSPDTVLSTETLQTSSQNRFILKHIADNVVPGTTYHYDVYINGDLVIAKHPQVFHTQPLWQYRTDPPNFTIGLGSCTYFNEPIYDRPGEGYGGQFEIFNALQNSSPDMMLWLGDNIYLREVDWYSKTGIAKRYEHFRQQSILQPFWSSTHHYAIWDDHDFGPNNADRSFPFKSHTRKAFERYWGNPTTGIDNEGITTFFQFRDMDFFLLDNRFWRTPLNLDSISTRTMLGQKQLDWVIEVLKFSRAPYKFIAIGGQVLNSEAIYENMANYPEERKELLDRIAAENIEGVVFLTGDRHHTELSKINHNGVIIYDFTVSPLTSGSAGNRALEEGNLNRIEGTYVGERNYGLIKVSGPRTNRKLNLEIHGVDGELIWEQVISR